MTVSVRAVRLTAAFRADLERAKPPIPDAVNAALKKLLQNPQATALRLHTLKGYGKPTIFKIDVETNHSWQITFELDGDEAVLLRLGTHGQIDRAPR